MTNLTSSGCNGLAHVRENRLCKLARLSEARPGEIENDPQTIEPVAGSDRPACRRKEQGQTSSPMRMTKATYLLPYCGPMRDFLAIR